MTIHTETDPAPAPLVAPPGLKGLIVADTTIGSVRGQEGYYHYRRFDAVELARTQSFESVAALLVDGELPDAGAEAAFRAELAAGRLLDPTVTAALAAIAPLIDSPLGGLRAAISLLASDVPTLDLSPAERRREAVRVAAAVPTVLAALHRLSHGLEPLAADPGLSHAADYVRLATGSPPTKAQARAVETYLDLTADHGFNASTFTARVVTSTGAGIGAVLAAAVGALSGPLHGGAPGRVLDMLDEIGDPAGVEAWARPVLEAGRPIMGFGHAVYRTDDPRSVLLREVAEGLGGELVARSIEIEDRILRLLRRWKPEATIVTNVEYYAAVVLHLAGIPQDMFTPTFTTSRVIGWVAHLLEQSAANKIMRPAARYVGPEPSRGRTG
ncbi:MAG: citrate/2-methylcitrate synthase [Acidimicrobiales bacterium]